jgi:hypothetical protein
MHFFAPASRCVFASALTLQAGAGETPAFRVSTGWGDHYDVFADENVVVSGGYVMDVDVGAQLS